MKKQVIIVGAGIIGLSCAYYLNKKGFEVTVLDNTDGSDNCSYGNAGFFSPSHLIPLASPGIIAQGLRWMTRSNSPFFIKPKLNADLFSWAFKFYRAASHKKVAKAAPVLNELLIESRSLIEDIIQGENLKVDLNKRGLLMYCKTQKALEDELKVAKLAQKFGQETQALNAKEAKVLNPGLDLDIAGAVLFKNDACITPHILMQELKRILLKKKVEFKFNTTLEKFSLKKNGSIASIKAGGEVYRADQYVLATGAWTMGLLKQLNLKLPMQAGKGYSFVLPSPKVTPQTCSILTEARVAVTPMEHGLRFAGTMEVNGMDRNINPKRLKGLIKSIEDYFPQFEESAFRDIEPWVGLRPCSPDGLPYIGKAKAHENLLVATGHAMLGVSLGPVTGKIISEVASGGTIERDLTLIEVDRYN